MLVHTACDSLYYQIHAYILTEKSTETNALKQHVRTATVFASFIILIFARIS